MQISQQRGYSFIEILFVLAIVAAILVTIISFSAKEFERADIERMDLVAELLLSETELYFREYCNEFMGQVAGYATADGLVTDFPTFPFQEIEQAGTSFTNVVSVADIRLQIDVPELRPSIADMKLTELFNLSPSTAIDPTADLNGWTAAIEFTHTVSFVYGMVDDGGDKLNQGLAQVELNVATKIPDEYVGSTDVALLNLFRADFITPEGIMLWKKKLRKTKVGSQLMASRRYMGMGEQTHSACNY